MTDKISVIMPAYNEAEHIEKNLLETIKTFSRHEYDFEILVVDDGSPDQTYLQAAKLLSVHPQRVRVVHYNENMGKGNALMCGHRFAKGEYVAFLDADMDLHPGQLIGFFDIMRTTGADVVIGSKWHPESRVNYPLKRRLYSKAYYFMTRLLFGLPIKDTQTGMKLFRREVLERVLPLILAKRFAFDIELLANAHRLGYKIVDAPVTLQFARKFGRINWKDVQNVLTDTLAIFYRMRIIRYYDKIDEERHQHSDQGQNAREIRINDAAG